MRLQKRFVSFYNGFMDLKDLYQPMGIAIAQKSPIDLGGEVYCYVFRASILLTMSRVQVW
jgi:hypothetical protein